MYPHQQQSIENVVQHFKQDNEVQALLLGGSIAHGFASPISDVDIAIIVSDDDHAKRLAAGNATYFNRELVTYPEGYVDGKYVSLKFMDQVRVMGSEPARFAFKDAQILFSRIDGLEQVLKDIIRYPVEEKTLRIQRFYAQLEAWYWYTGESLQKANPYLLGLSVSKLVLFGGRLILAHNEVLYPFHKWFLRVLEQAPDKPENFLALIQKVTTHPDRESIDAFFNAIKNFRTWETAPTGWPNQFMADSELNWITGHTPVDDI